MISSETIALLLIAGCFVLSALVLISAIWFYCTGCKEVSQKVYGSSYDFGFLYSFMYLFIPWGHYCLSEKRAERAGVKDIFSTLPVRARRHLIFQFVGTFAAAFMMGAGYLLIP